MLPNKEEATAQTRASIRQPGSRKGTNLAQFYGFYYNFSAMAGFAVIMLC